MLRQIERAGFRERRFDTGEVTLNYVEGPNNGAPLVLIPAQTGTWESYQRVLVPLSRRFQVFAVDVRGHGRSSWTTGDYSWNSVGRDLESFLRHVVRRPAIVSGNSSGGLIALWLAANARDCVSGIVIEDAPLFSAEWPRFRDRDRFVYQGLVRAVAALGRPDRDLADYFRGTELPVGRQREVPLRGV
jgi:pimeloyl-ACP methyl ester carboxylesterase